MRYLECRYDRSGYGTYIRAQIKTNLYDKRDNAYITLSPLKTFNLKNNHY